MSKIEFVIAIPTYNRLDNLKKAIESAQNQIVPNDVNLTILISNIASNDGTCEFLNSINSKNITVNNKPFKNHTNSIANFHCLSNLIPSKADWVWLHGDDDYLCDNLSLSRIINVIKNNSDLDTNLICACQKSRSLNSGSIHKDTIFNLCNKYGYHEILGWISGLILRKQEMKKVLSCVFTNDDLYVVKKDNFNLEKKFSYSAYPHSLEIFKNLSKNQAVFLDSPLIENQPLTSKQTLILNNHNAQENVGLRYLFMLDDFKKLDELDIIKKNSLSRTFFRYQIYYLWDHLLGLFVSRLNQDTLNYHRLDTKDKPEYLDQIRVFANLYWERVFTFSFYLKEKSDRKFITQLCLAAKSYSGLYLLGGMSELAFKLLEGLKVINCVSIYNNEIKI
ncbi:glycosyltransferase [Rickettsiales bacterium]|nr:glycosyltransferase [Rickettsiales bacterium]